MTDSQPRLAAILSLLTAEPSWRRVAESRTALDLNGPAAARPLLVAQLAQRQLVVALTATTREAEDLEAELGGFISPDEIAVFPSWETLPHERLSPSADVVGRRLHVLRRLRHWQSDGQAEIKVLITPIRSLLQPIVRGAADLPPVALRKGDIADLEETVRALAAAGYARVDLVDNRGQFAVRGGLIDIFPPAEQHPVRVEFWGDEVEQIRSFAVQDQRSLGELEGGLWAPPCRELLITENVIARANSLNAEHPELVELLAQIAEGIYPQGMESLAPVLAEGMDNLLELLPNHAVLVALDPERIRLRAHDLVATSAEFLAASWHNAASGNSVPIDLGAAAYRELTELRQVAAQLGVQWWTLAPFQADEETSDYLNLNLLPIFNYRGDSDRAQTELVAAAATGRVCVLVVASNGAAARLSESLNSRGGKVQLVSELGTELKRNYIYVVQGLLEHGFEADAANLLLITESDLLGTRASSRDLERMPSRRKRAIDPLSLRPGDYVVHEQHGVGRFVEMLQRNAGGAFREYLVIEYAPAKRGLPGDKLMVPTDQLDLVSRYVGGEAPAVHRLGGEDWAQAKSRARKAVRQIAAELIRLYAARNAAPGFAFSQDTVWQRELEDTFIYNETPDQLTVIDEVKSDMERPVPMDRVICGDVGYGKTEIAVRAAFKAVQDGKQVAVLVPTTLLVQQHTETFRQRYAAFPIKLKALSRFQSDSEAKAVIDGLASGEIDVVIGTHRLLGKDVKFKDLGLVIVDEEQRFGVEHKEHLKAMRTNVDVLTMSATPIPRTLEMSLTGIREMSTITTPPELRHPVLTYVGPQDSKQIAAAVRRELLRDGQVFYVHNRVASIQSAASKLQELVPEARIAVAHGQMNEHQLEQIILDFWEKRFDVLVSTTIVESGLDIPNANTLIVERADAFGLSQLHQLRGRVGRGRERAYAYFLYPTEKPLSETAHDRLATIAANTDLGSGMQVALKDLEIRGAGNLLGGEQSGHIAEVGFDLYVRLVGEALSEFKGESTVEAVETRIELPVDARLPHEYVPSERLRLEMYRRFADAVSEEDLWAARAELEDRYGKVPAPVETLLAIAKLRIRARQLGLREIVSVGPSVRFEPVELPDSVQVRLQRLYPNVTIKLATRTIVIPKPKTGQLNTAQMSSSELIEWVEGVLVAVSPAKESA